MPNFPFIPLTLWLVLTGHCLAADLEWVRVADDKRSFVLEKSGSKFIPWGCNYDHQEGSGRLIEDYWGKTAREYRPPKTIREAIVLNWLGQFQEKRPKPQTHFSSVDCDGNQKHKR